MSGQQPPPHPGPYGKQPSEQQQPAQNPQQPPPYPGPPPSQQPPPYPGQYGQPSYGQQQPYPWPYPQQPGQPPYPGQQYPGQQYPGYPPQPGYAPPPPKEPIDSTARMIGGIIAATGLLVAVAAFLTWGTFEGFGQSYDINGVTGSDFPGDDDVRDGVLTLILAIPVIGFAIVRALGQLSLTAAIIGTVAGALVILIAIIDIADISDTGVELPGGNIEVSIGVGLWLTLVGGIAMALASIIGIVKRR